MIMANIPEFVTVKFVEDLLAIVHVFSCRLYGLRRYEKQLKAEGTGLSVAAGSVVGAPMPAGVRRQDTATAGVGADCGRQLLLRHCA
jgi:hypothetical protein